MIAIRNACSVCHGDGKCAECNGTGINKHFNQDQPKCQNCGGSGVCQECGGTGSALRIGSVILDLGLND